MLYRWIHGSLLVLLMIGWSSASGDVIADWEAMRVQQQHHFDEQLSRMKLLSQTQMADVLRIRLGEKKLSLRTPMPSTPGEGSVRLRLQGVPHDVLLRIVGGAGTPQRHNIFDPSADDAATPAAGVEPENLQFSVFDYSQPRMIYTLSVAFQPRLLEIVRQMQYPTGYRMVQVLEQRSRGDSNPDSSLELVVNESSNGERPQVNLTLEAENFATFLERYPRESELYLRPVLRELQQEAVFAPDERVAWQVFLDQWKPDPAATQKVSAQLPALDDGDYRVRERAVAQLQALGRDGAIALLCLDRRALSLEQTTRIDRVLAPYAQLRPKEAARLRSSASFLLDCLYCDDVKIRQAALERCRTMFNLDPRHELSADPAPALAAIAAAREKLVPAPATTPADGASTSSPER